jgi:hypothetical protein
VGIVIIVIVMMVITIIPVFATVPVFSIAVFSIIMSFAVMSGKTWFFDDLIKNILNNMIEIDGRKIPTWLIGTGGLLGVAALAAIASAASGPARKEKED